MARSSYSAGAVSRTSRKSLGTEALMGTTVELDTRRTMPERRANTAGPPVKTKKKEATGFRPESHAPQTHGREYQKTGLAQAKQNTQSGSHCTCHATVSHSHRRSYHRERRPSQHERPSSPITTNATGGKTSASH